MHPSLLDLLVDPATGSPLLLDVRQRDGDYVVEGSLSGAATTYPVTCGVPRFVSGDGGPAQDASGSLQPGVCHRVRRNQDRKAPRAGRFAWLKQNPRLWDALVTAASLPTELSGAARWLRLRSEAKQILARGSDRAAAEREIIELGNRLFPQGYPEEMYRSYESYVATYPPSLSPYLALYDPSLWLRGKTVLDLGSGLGQYSVLLHEEGARKVVSLEYQYEKAAWALSHFGESPELQTISASADALPFRPGTFDAVFSHTVFEHLPDVPTALRSLASVLREDGVILLSYNFIHHRGGHHLFPYVQFPWAPWVVSEEALCRYWSERLAEDQAQGKMGFYPPGCTIRSLSEGNEIHLNKLTFPQFEAMVPEAGLKVVRRISSESLGRVFPFLRWMRGLKYFMTGTVYYALAPR